MSIDSTSNTHDRRAALSALMDGDGACDAVCRAWRGDADVRADWHAYHLIGDLMRSDEHRADAVHDAHMLLRLRERMKGEPVLLAPTPEPVAASASFAHRRRARAWLVPSAIAAGFVAVAGALVVTRTAAPDAAPAERGGVLAASPAPAAGVRPVAVEPAVQSIAETAPAMIRSAELDRYLSAHRQAANGALQVAPGGVARQAAVAAPGR